MQAEPTGRRVPPADRLCLADLVDLEKLQELQDWFAEVTGISAAIRDSEGSLITKSSPGNRFCNYVHRSKVGREACRLSNKRAFQWASRAVQEGKQVQPVKYVCHAGLTQFAAPITVGGQCLATLVVGDRPAKPLPEERVEALARQLRLDPEKLRAFARELTPWSDEEMRRSVRFLYSVAETIAKMGYQAYLLRQQLKELASLYETSRLLTSRMDLQQALDHIARHVTRALAMHACSIRLLVRGGRELAITSYYNLSQRYVSKGPVVVAHSRIDQQVLKGKVVTIRDMTRDRRVLYPGEASEEGLRSGIAVPLIARDRPIGALHLYSAHEHVFAPEEIRTIRAMANHAATAIQDARLFRDSQEKKELDEELRVAREIQERLLPLGGPQARRFDISAVSHPCRHVGGDFYDFIWLDNNRLAVVIADVSGKGIPAAILMAGTRAALRAQADTPAGRKPAELLKRVNRVLCADTSSSQFVSLFYAVLNVKTGYLLYSNAGHNPPLSLGRRLRWLSSGGVVLGAISDAGYGEGRMFVKAGDLLVLYTDGITEASNEAEERFGTERLVDVLRRGRHRRAADILQAVRDEVRDFTKGGSASDDRTIIVIRAR